MRTARPSRRQIEAATDGLDYDALAVDSFAPADWGYEVFDLPEFDFETRTLAEFEAAITPVVEDVAPVVELPSAWAIAGTPGQGKSAAALTAFYDFGEVA
ncbi:hypothetical protein [Amycolatopsis sp. lyj-108]|uniref:hypothetical protein n=1 Tax=Amycolatopsis sp. lyj-108 TaxID=2789286 RepID=UPI003979A932